MRRAGRATATPAQLAAIRAAHEGMSLTDMPGQHDRAFHSAIAAACGNAALAASVAHLWNLSQSSPCSAGCGTTSSTPRWEVAHAEHQRILTAISPATRSARAMPCMCLIGILARLRRTSATTTEHPPRSL